MGPAVSERSLARVVEAASCPCCMQPAIPHACEHPPPLCLQANEFMRSPVLPIPYAPMKSWSTGGETVSLDTILRMQEVRGGGAGLVAMQGGALAS